jgi:hypothetical protein
MKFGGKPTMRDKAKSVEARYGKTTGASKGSKPPPKVKIKPKISKGKVGVKATWKF